MIETTSILEPSWIERMSVSACPKQVHETGGSHDLTPHRKQPIPSIPFYLQRYRRQFSARML